MQKTQVPSLGQEDPLEKGKPTHSSILAWRTHGQRSLAGYSPWGLKRVRYDLVTKQQQCVGQDNILKYVIVNPYFNIILYPAHPRVEDVTFIALGVFMYFGTTVYFNIQLGERTN